MVKDETNPRWWTKKELLDYARGHGFELKERTFNDWVQRGLIANATRQGRGPGQGVASVWSTNQAHLLLKLLDLHKETSRLADLARLPVGLWLYFGDDYVDTKQAMKAMKTWADGYGSVSSRRAGQPARDLAEQIGGSDIDPRVRNRLVREIQEISPYPEDFNRGELVSLLGDVIAQSPNPPPMSADGIAFLFEARLRAIQAISEFTRADFEAARAALLTTLAEFQEIHGVQLPDSGISERVLQGPIDIASYFGMRMLKAEEEE